MPRGRPQILPDRKLTRSEINARWRAAHPDRAHAASRKWAAAHPVEAAVAHARWLAVNPERVALHERRRGLKRRYGITLEQYDAMLEAQGGVCAICGTDKAGAQTDTLHVDHDHLTGRVRGLLCFRCNRGIGVVESPRAPSYFAYLARTT